MEIEQMRIRMGEMAAEIERLQSIIDAQQSPRITEQDAGEILLSYGVEYLSVLSWIESKGRALLKKLNMVGVN
jgi:hypothetical protein